MENTHYSAYSLVYDQRRLHYWADVPALGDSNVRVSDRVLKEFGDTLLTSGAWGTMKIEFDPEYDWEACYRSGLLILRRSR